jgi:Ca2+-binding RTX toxin-like protein
MSEADNMRMPTVKRTLRRTVAIATVGILGVLAAPVAYAAPTCEGRAVTIVGTPGDDVIAGTTDNDVIHGLAGDDTISGGDDFDIICGGRGKDSLGGFNQQGTDDGYIDTLSGGAGNDGLKGSFEDRLIGGPGDDLMQGRRAHADYSSAAGAITVELVGGSGQASGEGTDTLIGIVAFSGSAFGDRITGPADAFGLGGNDDITLPNGGEFVTGGEGDDTITVIGGLEGPAQGGPGNDKMFGRELDGNEGNDLLMAPDEGGDLRGSEGRDILKGGPGVDGLRPDGPFVGAPTDDDRVSGGGGIDNLDYGSAPRAVTVNLSRGTATGAGTDTLTGIENVGGSRHGDTLIGDSGANDITDGDFPVTQASDKLVGGGGNDRLRAASGADTLEANGENDFLFGGHGNDFLAAGPGNDELVGQGLAPHPTLPPGPSDDDTLNGGSGRDLADFRGAPSAVIANLIEGTATGEGFDTLEGVEDLIGSRFGDTLTGNAASNFLHEGQESSSFNGNDTLIGARGADRLIAIFGNDTASGSQGNDHIDVTDQVSGNDTANGAAGTDLCLADVGDTVMNCEGP